MGAGPYHDAPKVRPHVSDTQGMRLERIRLALACALACACACGPAGDEGAIDPAAIRAAALARVSSGPHDVAVLDLGELGQVRIELLPELAPISVARFVALAESGFYDGTRFHRVIPGFMIQGGDPYSKNLDPRDDGSGGSGQSLADEFSGYPHVRGTVSLANDGSPGSSDSQFFIVHQDALHLDGSYSTIGRVSDGMATVDAVTRLSIDLYGRYGPRDRPYPQDAVIRSVRIERAANAPAPAQPLAAAGPPG
jgi:cyclophilin family peptidyl-prolyl cis-trans isomerase